MNIMSSLYIFYFILYMFFFGNYTFISKHLQWQIQDFLKVGVLTPKMDVKSYYLANFFPKTAWNWKNLDPEGAHIPGAPLDPPMIYSIYGKITP